jgi:hypothetical protein
MSDDTNTRRDYYISVSAAADDAAESIREHDADPHDAVHEAADGSYWVIYYHAAALTLQYSDNEDALFDECGAQEFDSHGDAITRMAAWAYLADVRDWFARHYREDGTSLDSLSVEDIEHLTETFDDAHEAALDDHTDYEGEAVMTSLGYVDLGADGSVTAHGKVLANVANNGRA